MSDTINSPHKKKKKSAKTKSEYIPNSKYSELEAIPTGTNSGLVSPTNELMLNIFGEPRKNKDYTQDDKGLDNKDLTKLHKSDNVGPFKVTGLSLALESLKEIMIDINKEQPDLYTRLGHDGMRNVRCQRGSSTKISNHAWGTAIDLMIDGLRDPYKDGKTQHGLTLVVPIFNRHGWYWGGAYKPKKDKKGILKNNEDAMHFEVGKGKILDWAKLGYLGPDAQKIAIKKGTHKLQGIEKSVKKKEDTSSRIVTGQALKPAKNPVAQKKLPKSNQLKPLFLQTPSETFPNWFGPKSKIHKYVSWFRKSYLR